MPGLTPGTAGQINNNIVTDGLVFYVDPAYKKSWNGPNSTNVNSLIGSATGSINNDTSGSYGDNNSFTFDGVDDKISIPPDPLATETRTAFTVSIWAKPTGSPSGTLFVNSNFNMFGMRFYSSYFDVYLYNIQLTIRTSLSGLGLDNSNWNNIALVMDDSASPEIEKIYVNGISKFSDTSARRYFNNTNTLFIGSGFNGDIGPTKMYSKALSAQEIKQNYNALKGRFGI